MSATDPRIDAYIARSAEFARPILAHLRALVHKACPDVEETLKWGMPHFVHKGMLCGMAAFKSHCTFGFWKADLVLAASGAPGAQRDDAMGQFGRLASLDDLPSDRVMIGYLKEAVRLNEEGIKPSPKPRKPANRQLTIPADLIAALKPNAKAREAFDRFSYSHRKEYVQWITEARRDETRKKRLAQTVAWLAEGKPRHWKYS